MESYILRFHFLDVTFKNTIYLSRSNVDLLDKVKTDNGHSLLLNICIGKQGMIYFTVENNAYLCRIEVFLPKINIKFRVSFIYDKLSIYIGHFIL